MAEISNVAYVWAVSEALDNAEVCPSLTREERERLIDELEAHVIRTMSADMVSTEGVALAEQHHRQYFPQWARVKGESGVEGWFDTSQLHAAIALAAYTVLVPALEARA